MTETTLTAPARPATGGPDLDAPAFRAWAAGLRGEVDHHVRHVFAWLDRCLETGEQHGEIAAVLAMVDLVDGKPFSRVLADLLHSADMWMPCPGEDDPLCRCGFCEHGRGAAADAARALMDDVE